jgi:hypothetical protein
MAANTKRNRKKKEAAPESAAASEHATEGKSERKMPDLPGVEGEGVSIVKIEALEEECPRYIKFRDLRMTEGLEERKSKKLIMALMDKHNLGSYSFDDVVFELKPKDETKTLKVTKKADYVGETVTED